MGGGGMGVYERN